MHTDDGDLFLLKEDPSISQDPMCFFGPILENFKRYIA